MMGFIKIVVLISFNSITLDVLCSLMESAHSLPNRETSFPRMAALLSSARENAKISLKSRTVLTSRTLATAST